MANTKDQDIKALLERVENNASQIDNVPEDIRSDENFIIQALQANSLVTGFLTKEELNNDRVALIVSLTVFNHKNYIKEKLQDENFYFTYMCQKIKNKEIDNKETYINKDFLSKEENVMRVIHEAGYFKMKYLHDNLKDREDMVDLFCTHLKTNQIWASTRIKEEALSGGVEVSQYVKTKTYYQKMDEKFPNKPEGKAIKI